MSNSKQMKNQKTQTKSNPEQINREIILRNVGLSQFVNMSFKQALLAFAVLASVGFVTFVNSSKTAPSLNIPVNNQMQYEEPLLKTQFHKSDSQVATEAASIMTGMLSYDWFNAPYQLNKQVSYFTNEGWLGFKEILEKSTVYNTIVDNKMISSLQIRGAPTVIEKGVAKVNGEDVAFWRVKMDGNLMFINSSGMNNRTDKVTITLTIIRVSVMESDYGMAVHRTHINFN